MLDWVSGSQKDFKHLGAKRCGKRRIRKKKTVQKQTLQSIKEKYVKIELGMVWKSIRG